MKARRLLASWLTSDGIVRALTRFRRPTVTVFALHRFAMPGMAPGGHDVRILRARLEYIRSRRIDLISARQAITDLLEGRPLERSAVAFTVDDGYADFAEAAAPVFAALDCPVTAFLMTDFVSGLAWPWWDMVGSLFGRPIQRPISVAWSGCHLELGWNNQDESTRCLHRVTETLKRLPDGARRRAIAELATALGVEIPQAAPAQYRAMTWNDVRRLEGTGVTFGPHTMSHPILANVGDARAEAEIVGSWQRLSQETREPLPVFCYPNGSVSDFTRRDQEIVARAGMFAAVSMIPGTLRTTRPAPKGVDRWALPRYAYPDDPTEFLQILSGIEGWKAWTRREHLTGRRV